MGNACQCFPGSTSYSIGKDQKKSEKEEPGIDDIVAPPGGVRSGSYRSSASKYSVSPDGVIQISTELPPDEFIDTRLAYTPVSEKDEVNMSRSSSYRVDAYERDLEGGVVHRESSKTHVEVMKFNEYDDGSFSVDGGSVNLEIDEEYDKAHQHYSEVETLQIPSRQPKRGQLNLAFDIDDANVSTSQYAEGDVDASVALDSQSITSSASKDVFSDVIAHTGGVEDAVIYSTADESVHGAVVQDPNISAVHDPALQQAIELSTSQRHYIVTMNPWDTQSRSSYSSSRLDFDSLNDAHMDESVPNQYEMCTNTSPASLQANAPLISIGDGDDDDDWDFTAGLNPGPAMISMPGANTETPQKNLTHSTSGSRISLTDDPVPSTSVNVFQLQVTAPVNPGRADGTAMQSGYDSKHEDDGDLAELFTELQRLDDHLLGTLHGIIEDDDHEKEAAVYNELSELSKERDSIYDDQFEAREEMYLSEELDWPADVIEAPINDERDLLLWYNQEIDQLNQDTSRRIACGRYMDESAIKLIIAEHKNAQEKLRKMRLREKLMLEYKLTDRLKQRKAMSNQKLKEELQSLNDASSTSFLAAIGATEAESDNGEDMHNIYNELVVLKQRRDDIYDQHLEEMYLSDEVTLPVDVIDVPIQNQDDLVSWYNKEMDHLNKKISKRIPPGSEINETAIGHILDEHKEAQTKLRKMRLREKLRLEGQLNDQLLMKLEARRCCEQELKTINESSKASVMRIVLNTRNMTDDTETNQLLLNELLHLTDTRDSVFDQQFEGDEEMYLSDEIMWPVDAVDVPIHNQQDLKEWYSKEMDKLNKETARKLPSDNGIDESAVKHILDKHNETQENLRKLRLREKLRLEGKLSEKLKMNRAARQQFEQELVTLNESSEASVMRIIGNKSDGSADEETNQPLMEELVQLTRKREAVFERQLEKEEEMYLSDEVMWPVDAIDVPIHDQRELHTWYSKEIDMLNKATSQKMSRDKQIDDSAIKNILDEHREAQRKLSCMRLLEKLRLESQLSECLKRKRSSKQQHEQELKKIGESSQAVVLAAVKHGSDVGDTAEKTKLVLNELARLTSRRDAVYDKQFRDEEEMYSSGKIPWPADTINGPIENEEDLTCWYNQEVEQLNRIISDQISHTSEMDKQAINKLISEHREAQEKLRKIRLRERLVLEGKLNEHLLKRSPVEQQPVKAEDVRITLSDVSDASDSEADSDCQELMSRYEDIVSLAEDEEYDAISYSNKAMSDGGDTDTDSCISQRSSVMNASINLKEVLKGDILAKKDMSPAEFTALMTIYRHENNSLRTSKHISVDQSLWNKMSVVNNAFCHEDGAALGSYGVGMSQTDSNDKGQSSSVDVGVEAGASVSHIGINTDKENQEESEQIERSIVEDEALIATLKSQSKNEDIQRLLREHLERSEEQRKSRASNLEKHNKAVLCKLQERKLRQGADSGSISTIHASDDEDVAPIMLQSRRLDTYFDDEFTSLAENCKRSVMQTEVSHDIELILSKYRKDQKGLNEKRQLEKKRMNEKMIEKLDLKKREAKATLQKDEDQSLPTKLKDMDAAFYKELRTRYTKGSMGEDDIAAMVEQHLERVKDLEHQARKQLREKRRKRHKVIDQSEVVSLMEQDKVQKQEAQRLRQQERQKTDEKLEEKLKRRKQKRTKKCVPEPLPPRRPSRETKPKPQSSKTVGDQYENVQITL